MAKKEKIGYKPIDNAYTRDIDAWFIILMIVIFFPVGLYLMWTRTSFPKWVKVTVTSIFVALFLVKLVSTAVQSGTAKDPNSETTVAEVTTVEKSRSSL